MKLPYLVLNNLDTDKFYVEDIDKNKEKELNKSKIFIKSKLIKNYQLFAALSIHTTPQREMVALEL